MDVKQVRLNDVRIIHTLYESIETGQFVPIRLHDRQQRPTPAQNIQRPPSQEKPDLIHLSTLWSRYSFPLLIGNYQRHLLSGETPTSATLMKRQSGEYYIQIQVKPKPPEVINSQECLGVDLGRRSIAYTSEGDNWDADAINKLRDHYANLRKTLSSKASQGTRSSRRRCRELLKLNHTISYRIVKSAANHEKIVAIEDLTGIREDLNQEPRSKEERRRTNSWSFYQLRVFLTYKSLKFGVKLITVPPAYTSKSCASCLRIGNRNGKSFKCECGWKCGSDHNASLIISRLGAAVNQPKGSDLFCLLDRDDSGLLKATIIFGTPN